MGELSLDGAVRPIKGALPMAIKAREMKLDGFILPKENAMEAAVVNNLAIYSPIVVASRLRGERLPTLSDVPTPLASSS